MGGTASQELRNEEFDVTSEWPRLRRHEAEASGQETSSSLEAQTPALSEQLSQFRTTNRSPVEEILLPRMSNETVIPTCEVSPMQAQNLSPLLAPAPALSGRSSLPQFMSSSKSPSTSSQSLTSNERVLDEDEAELNIGSLQVGRHSSSSSQSLAQNDDTDEEAEATLPKKKRKRAKRKSKSKDVSVPLFADPVPSSAQSPSFDDKSDMEALQRLLQCPACLEMYMKSMFLCENGHSICGVCREKIDKCPLCKATISETKNLLYEEIIDALLVQCDYSKEGCTMKIPEAEKTKHVAQCHFRPMECNFGICRVPKAKRGVQMKYRNYISHLIGVHEFDYVTNASTDFRQYCSKEELELFLNSPWHESVPMVIQSFGRIFLTGNAVINGKIIWWIYIFADEKTADGYISTISLTNRSADIEMSWTGPVHNIRVEPKIIANSGLCLMLQKENFLPFTYATIRPNKKKSAVEESAWDMIFTVQMKEVSVA